MTTYLTHMDYLRLERTKESWQGLVVGFCEHGSASLTSVKGGGLYLDQQRDHQHDDSGLLGCDTVSLSPPGRFKGMLVHTLRVTRRHIPEEL